jgi:hypothetical protein
LDHQIQDPISAHCSIQFFDPFFRSIFPIQFFDPCFRSNFPIQFFDPNFRSNFSIQFFDPDFRSNFSIQFFDPIFRSNFPARRPAEYAAWQLASRPAGQRGRSASQQTATEPASHPASPAASPQLATATSHRSLHLGKLKGENMFPSYFRRMPHVTDAQKACLAEIRQADRSRKI